MSSRLFNTTVLGLLFVGSGSVAFAGAVPSIQDIGLVNENGIPRSWPTAVSPNGEFVVGHSQTNFPASNEAFIWNAGNLTGLGDIPGSSGSPNGDPSSFAFDVSGSGRHVVGSMNASFGTIATIWDFDEGLIHLGDLRPVLPGLTFDSEARGVTPDGALVVGRAASPNGSEAFVWHGMMSGLGDLPGGEFDSVANGISADGSVIVGTGHSAAGQEAFIYTNNTMTGLGDLDGGDLRSAANAVSSDGSTVVGWGTSQSGTSSEAFVWRDGAMTGLGDLPGGSQDSEALAVSGDGSIVVGRSESNQGCGSCSSAFIWDSINGMRLLEDVLTNDYGIDLDGWFLDSATAISDDGLTIAGYGYNESLGSFSRGFVITLPEPSTLLIVAAGAFPLCRRRR